MLRMRVVLRLAPLFLLAVTSCAADEGSEALGDLFQALGTPLPSCSDAPSSGYDEATKVLSLTLGGGVTEIVAGVTSGTITVNGWPCLSPAGVPLTTTTVHELSISGTGADEAVTIDLAGGSFSPLFAPSKGGISLSLGGGTDELAVSATETLDRIRAGQSAAGDVYVDVTNEGRADIGAAGTELFKFALLEGADTFHAMGGAITAAHMDPAATSLTPMTAAVSVYGGEGNDQIQGGLGDDLLFGGVGDDTFKCHAGDDGGDVIEGGAGIDLADYSTRTAGVTVSIGAEGVTDADDGLPGEGDDVRFSVENVTGGSGDDDLTGSVVSNVLTGAAGHDTLSGGPAGSDCAADVDTLSGGDGDDRFDMGAASSCADAVTGGPGRDTADYQARSVSVSVSLDGGANDGEAGELDKVSPDVEVVLGGSAADTLTGSSNADELHGGAGADVITGGPGDDILVGDEGDDTLNGGAGDDTFLESGPDTLITGAPARGAGSDTLNGGAGRDSVSYASRTADVVATLCVDTALTGPPTSTAAACTDSDGEAGEGDRLINVEGIATGSGDDVLTGSAASEVFECGAGDDVVFGGGGDDTAWGDGGSDELHGDAGDDHLDGGAGDDVLEGGGGEGDICVPDASDSGAPSGCELL